MLNSIAIVALSAHMRKQTGVVDENNLYLGGLSFVDIAHLDGQIVIGFQKCLLQEVTLQS